MSCSRPSWRDERTKQDLLFISVSSFFLLSTRYTEYGMQELNPKLLGAWMNANQAERNGIRHTYRQASSEKKEHEVVVQEERLFVWKFIANTSYLFALRPSCNNLDVESIYDAKNQWVTGIVLSLRGGHIRVCSALPEAFSPENSALPPTRKIFLCVVSSTLKVNSTTLLLLLLLLLRLSLHCL